MAKSIMIQGTMSNVGKSALAAGLCRVLKQDGYKVAPFKSQNMALNSFITREGLEMGRAQVMQAEAAGIEPEVAMNPILLKPTNDTGSQVIINGKPIGVMAAREYFRHKKEYIPAILEAYHELEKRFDIIVIEGAGSPAEINLKKDDIVNMGMAKLVDAPVLLVGDIDRGGVFAQIAGTVMLLEEEERKRIKGTIINKFRGDVTILEPGLRMLEEKTDIPVTGVVPYFYLDLDEEDSLTERFQKKEKPGLIDLAVIRLPRISNFTDLAPLEALEEVSVRYVSSPAEFGNPDAVILPGTKNTISDLLWMRQNGLEAKILKHSAQGKLVFGICGGYQMLGLEISDPEGEEYEGTVQGMRLLNIRTIFRPEKHRTRVTGNFGKMEGILKEMEGVPFEGYEIHMGETELVEKAGQDYSLVTLRNENESRNLENESVFAKSTLSDLKLAQEKVDQCNALHTDGAQNGNVYGCYVHGIFDAPQMTSGFLSALLREKGYDPDSVTAVDWKAYKEEQYDKLADVIRGSLNMEEIYRIIEEGN